jgi:hypothetical protein
VRSAATVILAAALLAGCSAAPSVTPSDTPQPPAVLGAGLPYECDGAPFDVRVLSGPAGVETGDDPAAAGLRALLRIDPSMPAAGWRVAYRTALEAEFLAPKDGVSFGYVVVEPDDSTGWRAQRWGFCELVFAAHGDTTAEWALAPGAKPGPADRVIPVVIVDRCQSEQVDRRIRTPIVQATSDAILVIVTLRPGIDSGDVCDAFPPYATSIELPEAIGNRVLLDAGHWPPRDATKPLEP